MNPSIAVTGGLGVVNLAEMLALPGLRAADKNQRISGVAKEIIDRVSEIVDELVVSTIQKRTALEFEDAQDDVFPLYYRAVRSLSDLARIVVPKHVREILMAESFSTMEADFRDAGLEAFGASVRDQAIFTVWTLRKISDLCQKIDAAKLDPTLQESDRKMFDDFVWHAISARFYLDCLLKSMDTKQALVPGVFDIVIEGLRNAVNAYAWARRAYDLRVPRTEAETDDNFVWDDEDKALLFEASHDGLPEAIVE